MNDEQTTTINQLVEENLGLAYWRAGYWAKKVKPETLTYDEILSVTFDALLYAAKRYKPGIARFSTYTVSTMDFMMKSALTERNQERPTSLEVLSDLGYEPTDPQDVEHEALTAALAAEVQKSINLIPNARWRRVLRSYYFEHKTLYDIATEMNVSAPRVRDMRDRAVSQLRYLLRKERTLVDKYVHI